MVLEWVDGRLLRQILNEQKPFPPERAIRITLGISAKPSIIFIARELSIAT